MAPKLRRADLAERVGFEPTDRLPGQRFSRPPHSTALAPLLSETPAQDGGEGGIRTHGRVSPTHAFQACSLSHSDTSPDAGKERPCLPPTASWRRGKGAHTLVWTGRP